MPIKASQAKGAPARKITTWSFSRFHEHRTCPRKAKYKFIDKLKEPEGPALARGNHVHKLAEDFALGRLKRLPPELALFPDEFKELKKHKARLMVEQQWALSAKWEPVEWFGYDAWCRVVVDVAYFSADQTVMTVIDHKTGKVHPYQQDQLSLYALAGFAQSDTVERVYTKLWYLDQGEEKVETYTLDDVPRLKKQWAQDVKPMLSDTRFKPNPGNHCRFCHFRRGNGGPCEF